MIKRHLTSTCTRCGAPCTSSAQSCATCRPIVAAEQNRAERAHLVTEAARLNNFGWTAQSVAVRLGLSSRTVERYLAQARVNRRSA